MGGLKLRNFAEATLILVLFFLTIAFVPFVNSVLVLFVPLTVMLYYEKLGRLYGALCIVTSLVATAAILQYTVGEGDVILFLLLSCLGVIIAEVLRQSFSIEKTIVVTTAAGFLLSAAMIVLQSIWHSVDPLFIVKTYITKSVHENIDLYSRMEVSSDQVAMIRDNVDKIVDFLIRTFPALTIVGSAFVVWINIIGARGVFKAYGMTFPNFGDLTRWKTPDKTVWLLIAAGGATLVPWVVVKWAGINVLFVCLFVYFLQGMAVVTFFFKTRRVPFLLQMIFYTLLALQQYLLVIVIIVGLFDLWIDFRKLNRPLRDEGI
ncbi:MAG: YybS family protein [Syntrophales bacterium]|nr:YybS family protein [Syntrophales bacterium]